jgi:membrane fusion protein, multidrug efflux system
MDSIMNDTALPQATVATSPAPLPKRVAVRPIILGVVATIVVLGVGSFIFNWFTHGRFVMATDDAYVGASIATISSKVAGHIVSVPVASNQTVKTGDLLAKIDDGDYLLAVESAAERIDTQTASMARIDQQIEQQSALLEQARAQIAAAEADAQRAASDYERQKTLAAADFNSRSKLDQAVADRDRTAANLQSAKAGLIAAQAGIDVLKAQKSELDHSRTELETALAKAKRDLSFTEIRAPFNGVVGNKVAEIGMLVQPGTRLMALVPLDAAYVDANFKETQLDHIKPGMKATVHADAFPGRIFTGTVASFAPATGSQFSLLPPENATGNFTKIVQRVPVRIVFNQADMADGALRPGLSVVVEIDTKQ